MLELWRLWPGRCGLSPSERIGDTARLDPALARSCVSRAESVPSSLKAAVSGIEAMGAATGDREGGEADAVGEEPPSVLLSVG